MATIKTTLKVETNALPFPINHTSSTITNVNVSNLNRVTISNGEEQILTPKQFGTEGGYVYAQSSVSNVAGTIVNLWLIVPVGSAPVQLATINPGESILLPLSPLQTGVYATTNLGKTAVLDFYSADKGGKWGENTVLTFNNESTWKYIVVDVNLGQKVEKIDSGISVSFVQTGYLSIQDKGHMFGYYNSGTGQAIYVFIDSRGKIVENTIPTDAGTSYVNLGGRGFAKLYGNNNEQLVTFNGNDVFYHSFEGAGNLWIDEVYDLCTNDGSFIIYAEDYDGVEFSEKTDSTFLINGGNKILLSALEWNSGGPTPYQYNNTYCYSFANFVVVETYDDDNNIELRYRIFDTTGRLLHDLDVSGYEMHSQEMVFYGDNTVFFMLRSYVDNYDYLFNYNHELDRFTGKDMTWKDNHNEPYNYKLIRYGKEIGWSNNYQNGSGYEPNGLAIVFYTNDDYSGWAYLDQYTTDCRIHYLVDGMSSYSVYVPSKPIWFETSYPYATKTNVFFVWGDTNGRTTTPLKLLTLNSTPYTVQNIDANSVTILADFEPYQVGNGHVERYPAGNDYLVHYFNGSTFYTGGTAIDDNIVIAKRGLVRALPLAGADYGAWYAGFNTFMVEIYMPNEVNNTNYYYNFTQNTFVNLNKWYDYIRTFPSNYGSFGPGDINKYGNKILAFQPPGALNGVNPSFRLLTGSSITTDIALPIGNIDEDWGYNLGNDFFLWYYKNTNSGPWIVNTYDNTGTLISTYDTGSANWEYDTTAGNRIFNVFQLPSGEYQQTWISKKGAVISPDNNSDGFYMNDINS